MQLRSFKNIPPEEASGFRDDDLNIIPMEVVDIDLVDRSGNPIKISVELDNIGNLNIGIFAQGRRITANADVLSD